MASEIFGKIYNEILTDDQKRRIRVGEKYVVTFTLHDLGNFMRDLTTTVKHVNRGKFEVESMLIKEYTYDSNDKEEIDSVSLITDTGGDSSEMNNYLNNWNEEDVSLENFDVVPYEKYIEIFASTPETRYFIHCSSSGYTIK